MTHSDASLKDLLTEPNRALIGRFVAHEVESHGSWNKFAVESGVSRATLYRIRDVDPTVTPRIFRQVERGMSLAPDTFATIAVHDWGGLREMGLEEGIIRWLEKQAASLT